MKTMQNRGRLYVIAAPSGAGKTSLVNALIKSVPSIVVSISHTTRAMRPNEVQGVDYYFVSDDAFNKLVDQDEFLEHAIIFDRQYGTSKKEVIANLNKGFDVILEIDWQGHQQIKKLFPESISVFVLPPSLKDLENRLVTRNQDPSNIIAERLNDAKKTISHIAEFDYIVLNKDFDDALRDLRTIVEAERLRKDQQILCYKAIIDSFKGK